MVSITLASNVPGTRVALRVPMARGLATVKDAWADETAWEESLSALAEELWFWAVAREGMAARGVSVSQRQIARARLLARDVLIISALPDAMDTDRAAGLLEAAHELLNGGSGVRTMHPLPSVLGGADLPAPVSSVRTTKKTSLASVPGMPSALRAPTLRVVEPPKPAEPKDDDKDEEDEETLPRRMNPHTLRAITDDDDDDSASTSPGVPIEVFRAYLATR